MASESTLIKRFRLSKTALKEVPREEVELFLVLGHLHNELTVLHKLVVWSFSGDWRDVEPHLQAQIAQSMILLRHLAARLFEGWQTLQKGFFGRKFSKHYIDDLAEVALRAYEEVRSYNSRKNPLKSLRDGYAVHSSGKDIGRGLEHLADETLDIYLGRSATDNLFYASEVVLNISILQTSVTTEREKKLDILVGEIVTQAGYWMLLLQGVIDVFLRRYPSVQEEDVQELELQELVDFDMVTIPWFTSPPESGQSPNPGLPADHR